MKTTPSRGVSSRTQLWTHMTDAGLLFFKFQIAMLLIFASAFHTDLNAQTVASDYSKVFYAGGGANTVFHDAYELSDGTILVSGASNNLDWIPSGVAVTPIATSGLAAPSGSAIPFLLRLSGDTNTVLNVVHLPAGSAVSIRWIRSTEVPGSATGLLYVSGQTSNGYFIGRLNGNFVNAVPTGFTWVYPVQATSGHQLDQPWDVGNDGRVVYGHGGQGNAMVGFLNPQGQPTKLPQLRASHFVGSAYQRGLGTEFPSATFSTIRLPTDNVSWNDTDLFTVESDGNGGLRQGKWPIDIMITHSYDTGEPINVIDGKFYGYNGYRTAGNHWIGSVAIDRRNNYIYYGFNIQSVLAPTQNDGENPDFEPAVICYAPDGAMLWWSRLYREAADTNNDGIIDVTWRSEPDQYIDGLGIDYSVPLSQGGDLIVVARCHGNNSSNFWAGNFITSNPSANGFQNRFTGNEGNIHIGWIGRLTADEGELLAATYVGGFFRKVIGAKGQWPTTPYPEAIHDGWPSHNAGWPDLTTTRMHPNTVRVGLDGRIHVVGTGPRMVTTSNAFQKLPRRLGHNNPILNEGTSPWSDWMRAYEPDLAALAYSSALTGVWTYPNNDINADPVGASNIKLNGIFPITGGSVVVGQHSNSAGTSASGNNMPTANVTDWGDQSYNGVTAVIGLLPFSNDRPVAGMSVSVNGASVSVSGLSSTSVPNITSYEWRFGDGTTKTGATANHQYGSNGTYLIGLKVTNSAGLSAWTHQWVQVSGSGGIAVTGTVNREWWTGITGTSVNNLTGNSNYPNNPTGSDTLTSLRAVSWNNPSQISNWADNYGQRIRGYIVAPATGSYTFWISSDDSSQLWLSTNSNPANRQLIASVSGYTNTSQWNKYASQKSAVIQLQAGTAYYVEVLHKEGTGGDNLAVGWLKPGQTGTVPSEIVPGSVLAAFSTSSVAVTGVSVSPTSLSLQVGATGQLTATVAPSNATNKTVSWSSSNTSVATVSSSGLVTAVATGNATITVTTQNGGFTATTGITVTAPSSGTTITMDSEDSSGIVITGSWNTSTSISGYLGSNYLHDNNSGKGSKSVKFTPTIGEAGLYEVAVLYSSASNRTSNVPITIAHNGETTQVTVDQRTGGGDWVVLGSYYFAVGTGNSVTISNVGTNGFVIVDAVRFVSTGPSADVWMSTDIGNPALAGSAVMESANSFTITGAGADIWGNSDSFHYAYLPITGDAEIVARVVSLTNTDPWAKAGVMIRESLDANSKHASMVVTPSSGASFQRRVTTGGSSAHTTQSGHTAPIWVSVVRVGDTFSTYRSSNGDDWILVGSAVIPMAQMVYIGLAVTSHNTGSLTTAAFDDVWVW